MAQERNLSEYFRWITPVLVSVAVFMLGNLDKKINSIDDKLFKHLTNDDMHAPRSLVVAKPEFDIYQQMRNSQMDAVEKSLTEIKALVQYHMAETK